MSKKVYLKLSAGEWVQSYRTALSFLKALFQHEESSSTGIKRTEKGTATFIKTQR